jgi:hypothetical protein
MGKSQRNKGAGYERELGAIFSTHFGTKITRKLGQARDSGNDLDAGPFVVEAKRRKSLKTLMGWWNQARASAMQQSSNRHAVCVQHRRCTPIVVMREDNGPNMVFLQLEDFLALIKGADDDII